MESGDFWLSETPDKPSWVGMLPAVTASVPGLSSGTYRRIKNFTFSASTLTTRGSGSPQKQSGKLMVQKIKEIHKNEPVICVGDLNSTLPIRSRFKPTNPCSMTLTFQLIRHTAVGTFNGFKLDAPLENRIDYVFVKAKELGAYTAY